MKVSNDVILSICDAPSRDDTACAVTAWGAVEASLEKVAELRRHSDPYGCLKHAPKFLKQADEQTVVGLASVSRAVQEGNLGTHDFSNWAVVAAPRFVGRISGAVALDKFARTGGTGTSPHLISQQSLHSMAGMISIALESRGPNFGVGGGPGALREGLLAALTLAGEQDLAGLWLVATEWEPEPVPDGKGGITENSTCRAVALSLSPAAVEGSGLTLQRADRRTGASRPASVKTTVLPSAPTVRGLIQFLADDGHGDGGREWTCPAGWNRQPQQSQRRRAA